MKTNEPFKLLMLFIILSGFVTLTSCSNDDDGVGGGDLTGILEFGFIDPVIKDFPFEVDNINYVIKNNDSLPYDFDISSLTAEFTAVSGSTVKVNGVAQESGVTVNDFTDGLVYEVFSGSGSSTRSYDVQLNIAQVNPGEVEWQQKSPNAFSAEYDTQEYFYMNGKHWVVLGKEFAWFGNPPESKLYSSEDGSTWVEESPAGDFPVGYEHNIVVRNNKAYVVGLISGVDNAGSLQPTLEGHLYTSEDGVTWTKEEDAFDDSRILTPAFNLDSSLYVFGGNLQGAYGAFDGAKAVGAPFYPAAEISPTTLVSSSGSSFTTTAEYTEDMPKRTKMASYVYDGKMYIAGGLDTQGFPLNDVWSSTDGVNWTQVSSGAFDGRIKASTIAYDDDVYMFGGQLENGETATETLVSEDGGVSWNPVSEDQSLPTNYKDRSNANVSVDANGYVWIVGGEEVVSVTYNSDGTVDSIEYATLTDVWSGKLNSL